MTWILRLRFLQPVSLWPKSQFLCPGSLWVTRTTLLFFITFISFLTNTISQMIMPWRIPHLLLNMTIVVIFPPISLLHITGKQSKVQNDHSHVLVSHCCLWLAAPRFWSMWPLVYCTGQHCPVSSVQHLFPCVKRLCCLDNIYYLHFAFLLF